MSKKTIFIVDDDEMLAMMLSDHLSKNSRFTIHTYSTGEDCIRDLDRKRPDIIILDYYLNSVNAEAKDGLAILKRLKQSDEDIHVIMLSSQASYGKAMQTLVKGAMDFVIKDDQAFHRIDEILTHVAV